MTQARHRTRVDAIAIGRNEGARLAACLASLNTQVRRVIYVDSGSTDDSRDLARSAGAQVITLDLAQPFTAARARNAGLAVLAADPPELVQFIDGDCSLQPGWIDRATDFLDQHPQVAVVCGRRRERHPDASVYNALCDAEWDTPPGVADACGGDALMRYTPLAAVGGYRADLIAGEEPELCRRLRASGWAIWRLDTEMTLHDADLHHFSQWWRRSERAGYAYAQAATAIGTRDQPFRRREYLRLLLWGLGLPAFAIALALALHPAGLGLLLAYPLQIARLTPKLGFRQAFFTVLGKFAEAQGALRYHLRRLRRGQARLIEYK